MCEGGIVGGKGKGRYDEDGKLKKMWMGGRESVHKKKEGRIEGNSEKGKKEGRR